MTVKYELDKEGWIITDCPHGEKHKDKIIRAGTWLCTTKCRYYGGRVSHSRGEVECNFGAENTQDLRKNT